MLEHGAQSRFIDEVSHTQSSTCDFVFVGRSDPTPCGTDLCIASSFFTREVEGSGVGHDDECIGADLQSIGDDGELAFFKYAEFIKQYLRVVEHSSSNHAKTVGMQNTRKDQEQ